MAREVQIVSWCDVCLRDDSEKTSTTVTHILRIDHGPVRQLDLCDEHGAPLVATLELVAGYGFAPDDDAGRRASAPAVSNADVCPICGERYASTGSLGHHLRTQHNTSRSELGMTDRKRSPSPEPCEACGFRSASPQGMAAHRRIVHDLGKRRATATA